MDSSYHLWGFSCESFCNFLIFTFQSAPWWLPIERVFWRQVRFFFPFFLAYLLPHFLCRPFTPLTLYCSACRTWLRHSGAPGLPGGSGELERCSGFLPVEGQETAYGGGVGVGCTWGAARYTVYTLKSCICHHYDWVFFPFWQIVSTLDWHPFYS